MLLSSSLEPLESRIAPAAITATLAAGKLTISGDADPNSLSITSDYDGLHLGAGSGSHLIYNGTDLGDGASTAIVLPVTSISIDLKDGDNQISLNGVSLMKDLSLSTGAGTDSIALQDLNVGGSLKVKAGDGNDAVTLSGTIATGKLAIDLGNGTNSLQFNNTADLIVGSTAQITGGADVDTLGTSYGANFRIGTDLSISLGNGDNSIGITADAFAVGGKFSITQGDHTGAANVSINSSEIFVGKDFLYTATGGGSNGIDFTGTLMNVGGKTTIKSAGDAADSINFHSSAVTLTGASSFSLGEGNNSLTLNAYEGLATGAISYTGGAGSDSISFPGSYTETIHGLATFNLGDGANSVSASSSQYGVTFSGGLSITGGKDGDSLTIQGERALIGGAGLKLALGDGANSAEMTPYDSLGIHGSVSFTSGVGDSHLKLSSGSVSVVGSVSATFGDGAGSVELSNNNSFISDSLIVTGSVTFTAHGGGADTLTLSAGSVVVKGAISASGDAGALNVNLGRQNEASYHLGAVTMMTKAGGGSLDLLGSGTVLGTVTYKGGTGANNLDITTDRYFGNRTTVLHGAVNFTSTAATGTENFTLSGVRALGPITAKFAGAVNQVNVDDLNTTSAVSIDTGDGNDTINLERGFSSGLYVPTKIAGPLKLALGAGDDTVNLGYNSESYMQLMLSVNATSTLIDGGDGQDTVSNGNVVNTITPTVIVTEKGFETVNS